HRDRSQTVPPLGPKQTQSRIHLATTPDPVPHHIASQPRRSLAHAHRLTQPGSDPCHWPAVAPKDRYALGTQPAPAPLRSPSTATRAPRPARRELDDYPGPSATPRLACAERTCSVCGLERTPRREVAQGSRLSRVSTLGSGVN